MRLTTTTTALMMLGSIILSNISLAQTESYYRPASTGKLRSLVLSDQQDSKVPPIVQEPGKNLLDVPRAPVTNQQQLNQPALEVQSNAQFIDEEAYKRSKDWCKIKSTPDRIFGCSPRGICVGGWFDFGYHTNSNGLFNRHPNDVVLQQGYVHIEKFAERTGGIDWGFRFDAMYGVDGPDLQANGNSPAGAPDDWDTGFD